MDKNNPTEMAQVAGFFDARATIDSKYKRIEIRVGKKDILIFSPYLEELIETFGGIEVADEGEARMNTELQNMRTGDTIQPTSLRRFRLNGSNAARYLRLVLPYMRVEKKCKEAQRILRRFPTMAERLKARENNEQSSSASGSNAHG
jgi:hypothetical protein